MQAREFLVAVLDVALDAVASQGIAVYTFALYHDHESAAVSVCVDTGESSARFVASVNRCNMTRFARAVAEGDLRSAAMWTANVGRNLSLGDFALVNVARTPLGDVVVDDEFHVAMAQSLMAVRHRVAALSARPERLIFACSGPDDEVALVWAMPGAD